MTTHEPEASQSAMSEVAPAADAEEQQGAADSSTIHISDLQCPMCMEVLCKPITVPCGHSFCTVCLNECQKKSKKRCPSCRAVLHVNVMQLAINVTLDQIAQKCFPSQYKSQIERDNEIQKQWENTLPIFFYNKTMFPGQKLKLHLFEPRYMHMITRAISESRRFVYLPNYGNYTPANGDVGLVVHLDDCQFFADGRCNLEATMRKRIKLTNSWMEDSTFGLYYCEFEYLEDLPIPQGPQQGPQSLEELKTGLVSKVDRLFELWSDGEALRAGVERQSGPEPSREDLTAWSLWVSFLTSVVCRMQGPGVQRFLATVDVEERLKMCDESIGEILERLRTMEDESNATAEGH